MYIPFWLIFAVTIWTFLGAELSRKEAYAAGIERRTPDYRSCWGLASIIVGMFAAAFGAIVIVTPLAIGLMASVYDVALRQFS